MVIDAQDLREEARGKWLSIFQNLGISWGKINNSHCSCPACGGKDRARFDDKDGDGTYFCNNCGAGNGFSLVQKCLNITFRETLVKIQSIVGGCVKMEIEEKKEDIEQNRKNLNSLWLKSVPLTGGCDGSKYFHGRKLSLQPDNVQYCGSCYEPETKTKRPALIAKIVNANNKPISISRIYLKKDDLESGKKIMPKTESLVGSAVRLFSPESKMFDSNILGIAEGIETAMSCTQMYEIATWACLSSTLMENWEPPEKYKKIVIYGDNDANFAGQKSAYTLAKKLFAKGLVVNVVFPILQGTDFNDELMNG